MNIPWETILNENIVWGTMNKKEEWMKVGTEWMKS
jgi:hypothetical protein